MLNPHQIYMYFSINAPALFSKHLILSYLLYLSYCWQFKEYSSAGIKKNCILYSKNYYLRE